MDQHDPFKVNVIIFNAEIKNLVIPERHCHSKH